MRSTTILGSLLSVELNRNEHFERKHLQDTTRCRHFGIESRSLPYCGNVLELNLLSRQGGDAIVSELLISKTYQWVLHAS